MKQLSRLPVLLALCLLTPEARAQHPRRTNLARAANTFQIADADRDGVLGGAELKRASIHPRVYGIWDKDLDGKLSKDEFLLYYKQLLLNSKQVPGPEYEKEAQRILKFQQAEVAKRIDEAREKAAVQAAERTANARKASTAEKYRKAQAALDERIKAARKSAKRKETDRKGSED